MVVVNTGHILAGTKIAADWWVEDSTPLVDFYFCSHVLRLVAQNSLVSVIYYYRVTIKLCTLIIFL